MEDKYIMLGFDDLMRRGQLKERAIIIIPDLATSEYGLWVNPRTGKIAGRVSMEAFGNSEVADGFIFHKSLLPATRTKLQVQGKATIGYLDVSRYRRNEQNWVAGRDYLGLLPVEKISKKTAEEETLKFLLAIPDYEKADIIPPTPFTNLHTSLAIITYEMMGVLWKNEKDEPIKWTGIETEFLHYFQSPQNQEVIENVQKNYGGIRTHQVDIRGLRWDFRENFLMGLSKEALNL